MCDIYIRTDATRPMMDDAVGFGPTRYIARSFSPRRLIDTEITTNSNELVGSVHAVLKLAAKPPPDQHVYQTLRIQNFKLTETTTHSETSRHSQ